MREKGHEMADQCTYCEMHNKKYVVTANSSRCSECFGRNRKCDVSGPSLEDWEALEREETRLRQKKAKLEAEKAEAFSRILRLEQQSKATREKLANFRKRSSHMLKLELKTLDKLDAWEEREKEDAREATALAGSPAPPSTPGVIFDFLSPSTSFLKALNAGDRTPQATQGS